jgi:hypothetical protein
MNVIEAMNADNGYYPYTLTGINNNTTTVKIPSGVTVKAGTNAATETVISSTDGQTTVAVSLVGAATQGNVTGGRISYWSVQSTAVKYIYFGGALSSSTFVALLAS